MPQTIQLNTKNINSTFIKFAIPSILGLLIVSMQVIIDGLFVSKYVGTIGLAAVNLANPLISFIVSINLMIVAGGVVISGIALGNKDEALSKGYTSLTLIILITTILIISTLLVININSICMILGAHGKVFPYLRSYLLYIIAGAIFFIAPNYTEAFCRLSNRPNLVFISGLICVSINVSLDYVFLSHFGWGMDGAAIATCIANGCAFAALLPFVKVGKIRGSWTDIRRIFFNGSSEMLTSVSIAIATFIFNWVLMKYIGILGVAALTIIFYINSLVNFSLYGLANSLQPLVAISLGARNYDHIKRLLRIALIMGAMIGWGTYTLVMIFTEDIISIFTDGDEDLFRIAYTAATYISIHYLFSFVNVVASAFLTTMEKPLESATVAICRSIIFLAIPLLTLPSLIGEVGIWISEPITEILTLIISVTLIVRTMKRLKTLC